MILRFVSGVTEAVTGRELFTDTYLHGRLRGGDVSRMKTDRLLDDSGTGELTTESTVDRFRLRSERGQDKGKETRVYSDSDGRRDSVFGLWSEGGRGGIRDVC